MVVKRRIGLGSSEVAYCSFDSASQARLMDLRGRFDRSDGDEVV